MPEAKTLAVGVAILTILGMTVALAVPLGPSLTGDDDPENSGVTSAQEDPANNSTDDNSTDTDNDGDDDDPEDNDESGENGSSDAPPCESNGDSSDSSGESDCGSDDGTDDQDGEKNKDDNNGNDGNNGDNGNGADDQDGEKNKDDGDDKSGDGDDGTGDDGTDGNETDDGDDTNENGTDVIGTCEENGLVMNNTIANEAFGTENESGPISEVIHENEHYFMQGDAIVHESGCIVATIDNNAGGGDGGPSDQLPGDNVTDQLPGSDNGTDGNETDNGTDGELGTCETGGAIQENTLANELFGTENEDGPISSALHENEAQFQGGEPVVHEVSCGVATVDNNASGGGDLPESP